MCIGLDTGIQILVIEDEEPMRLVLRRLLHREGYLTTLARDGREGLDLAFTAMPDLVICDVTMPGIDGHQVLQTLRASPRGKSIPFVFLTGLGDRNEQRSGMNLGADDYLSKPFTSEELLTAIRVRLERSRASGKPDGGFRPDFTCSAPLEALGVSPREAEVLRWVAQGKSNAEIGSILGLSEFTVKRHMAAIFQKLGVDNRNAATLRALEALGRAH